MNNGKICVSVCAATADELIEQTKRAEDAADIIEIRLDYLKENELQSAVQEIQNLPLSKPILATFRPKEEGGNRQISRADRVKFWEFFFQTVRRGDLYVDFEWDLREIFNFKTTKSICSFHDFSGKVENLAANFEVYRTSTQADILKFAVQADDVVDSLAVWNLLERAASSNKSVVPVAMGESGKWTRILGLAHGAPFTYAAADAGRETAPGQIAARELIDVYRVKELDETTETYGIVGNPVAHSLSPFMHNAAFKSHALNAVYIPFEVKNLDAFIEKFIKTDTREVELNFKGFSVTSPHKQSIIRHLDEIDGTARTIGAVNTVKIDGGKLRGFNTDADGFLAPLKNSYGDLENVKVAILGNGGAARAAIYALKSAGAIVTIFARDAKKAESLAGEFQINLKKLPKTGDRKPETDFNDFDIVVNATPLGTLGALQDETPIVAAQMENVKLAYDLVYNPFETKFMREAGKANVPTIGGLAMLVAQGMKQFEIWAGKPAPMKEMGAAALRKLK